MLARALSACGVTAAYNAELAGEYFAEAVELARESDDSWRLSQILAWQANAAIAAGDPMAARMPPTKDAKSPRQSVTASTRATAACSWV